MAQWSEELRIRIANDWLPPNRQLNSHHQLDKFEEKDLQRMFICDLIEKLVFHLNQAFFQLLKMLKFPVAPIQAQL